MIASGATQRRLPSWIDSFVELTEGLPAPVQFRRWAGIVAVAGALERRVWTVLYGSLQLFPNQYVILVGPPASGKSVALNAAAEFWVESGALNVAPTSLTAKGMFDTLAEAKPRQPIINGELFEHHSLVCPIREMGVFLPEFDQRFLNDLTDLWDCPNIFDERIRMKKERSIIPQPSITILGCATPKYLSHTFPESAFGMGFMSRVVMVYEGKGVEKDPFEEVTFDEKLRKDLMHDFKIICRLRGQAVWEPAAIDFIRSWRTAGEAPRPDHHKLLHYNERRLAILSKLGLAAMAAEGDELILRESHLRSALHLMELAEESMPQIFMEMTSGSQADQINEAFLFMWKRWTVTGQRPISEQALVNFLFTRVPVNQINFIVNTMIRAGMIESAGPVHIEGQRMFNPIAKHKHGE